MEWVAATYLCVRYSRFSNGFSARSAAADWLLEGNYVNLTPKRRTKTTSKALSKWWGENEKKKQSTKRD